MNGVGFLCFQDFESQDLGPRFPSLEFSRTNQGIRVVALENEFSHFAVRPYPYSTHKHVRSLWQKTVSLRILPDQFTAIHSLMRLRLERWNLGICLIFRVDRAFKKFLQLWATLSPIVSKLLCCALIGMVGSLLNVGKNPLRDVTVVAASAAMPLTHLSYVRPLQRCL